MKAKLMLCCLLTAVLTACGDYQPPICGPGTHEENRECLPDNPAAITSPDAGYAPKQDAGNEEKSLTCGKGTKEVGNECLPLVEGVPCEDNDPGNGTPCQTVLCHGGDSQTDCAAVHGTLACGLGFYICPPSCQESEICGNGLDDNCDGKVDEGCSGSELPPVTVRDAVCDGYSIQSDPSPAVQLVSVTSEIHRRADEREKVVHTDSGDYVLTFLVRPATASSLKVSFRIETEKGYQDCRTGQSIQMKWLIGVGDPGPGNQVQASRWVLDNNCDGVFENYIEHPGLMAVSIHLYGHNEEWIALRDLRVENGEQQVSLHCQLETKCMVVYH